MEEMVRARIKSPEHMPDWANCCEGAVEFYAERRGKVRPAYPDSIRIGPPMECRFCNAPYPKIYKEILMADKGGSWLELEILDLDEGPLEVTP